MTNYSEFIQNKQLIFEPSGLDSDDVNEMLFNYQKDIVQWALKLGRAAIFADCGLGKSFMQIEGLEMLLNIQASQSLFLRHWPYLARLSARV